MSAPVQDAPPAMIQTEGKSHAVCDCCGLLAPRGELLAWQRRTQCRELAVMDPERRPSRRPEAERVSGVFRYYDVIQDYRVCHACFDHLLDGGEFAGFLRHRTKIGLVVLAAVVVVLIVCLPEILPVLKSALWLEKAEGN